MANTITIERTIPTAMMIAASSLDVFGDSSGAVPVFDAASPNFAMLGHSTGDVKRERMRFCGVEFEVLPAPRGTSSGWRMLVAIERVRVTEDGAEIPADVELLGATIGVEERSERTAVADEIEVPDSAIRRILAFALDTCNARLSVMARRALCKRPSALRSSARAFCAAILLAEGIPQHITE